MSENKSLDARLDFRITEEDKQLFSQKCADLARSPQSLLREMVQAVNESRLKISVTPEQFNNQQEIYDVN